MPRIVVPSLSLRLMTLAAALAAGCLTDGEEGETCTLTKDCLMGLVCDNPAGTGGVCRKPGDIPPRLDAAVVPDGSGRDTSATQDVAADRTVEAPRAEAGPAERPPGDALDAGAEDGGEDGGDGSADGVTDAPADAAVDAPPDGV
jgi:hypothetical protein